MSDITYKSHFIIPDKNIRHDKIEVPAGGSSYQRSDAENHGRHLLEKAEAVSNSVRLKSDYHIAGSLFLKISSPPDVTIKNEKLKLKKLGFEILRLFKEDAHSCIAKISKDNFGRLRERVYKYTYDEGHPGKSNLAILEDVDEVPVDNKLFDNFSNKQEKVIIYLYNTLSRKERFQILNQLELELSVYALEVESRIFLNGIIAISCKIAMNVLKQIVADYLTVKNVELNSMFFIKRSTAIGPLPGSLVISRSVSESVVAVIDSGIDSSSAAFRDQVVSTLLYLPPAAVSVNKDHGSFVASRCIYGDEIDGCLTSNLLTPFCKVLDVTVFGEDSKGKLVGPTNSELMAILEDVVIKYHKQIKVYNLSLGQPAPIADYEFSTVAKLIDALSKQYEVIFVIAAGNSDELWGNYPHDHFSHHNARLGSPGEALLGVTVGSIAKYEHVRGMAARDEISPFSRIGPGADLGLKPEIVCHGGNLIHDYKFLARVASYGIYNDGNQLAVDNGTSFAAPLVSQYIIRLMDAFPEAGNNLIKTLLYHFAQKRNIPGSIRDPHHFFTGFGEPYVDHSIFSQPDTLSYLYEGELDKKSYEYVGFHIPDIFKNKSLTKLKVKITIVFDPDVDPENDFEYSQARIAASLFKAHDGSFKEIHIDPQDKYSLAWNPILRFEKEFSRNFSCGYWELRMRMFTRGKLTEKYKQKYAVIVEIIDAKGNVNVFNEGIKDFGSLYTTYNEKSSAA